MKSIIILLLIFQGIQVFSQIHKNANVSQPHQLQINAGGDRSIAPGGNTQLGGSPTANFGTPGYIYFWQPASGLNSSTSANPLASPTVTTSYVLVVTDSKGCSSSDTVKVTIDPTLVDKILSVEDIDITQDKVKNVLNVSIDLPYEIVNTKFSIYNLIGQSIYSENISKSSGHFTRQINISNNAKGIYIFKIEGKGLGICKKFSIH